MSLRPPQSFSAGSRVESGWNVLGHEIAQQKAEALGDMGRKVEEALGRLRTFDASATKGDPATRAALVDAAADRVWALMVQREICGLRHWEAVVRNYGIPREVLVRMGRVTGGGGR